MTFKEKGYLTLSIIKETLDSKEEASKTRIFKTKEKLLRCKIRLVGAIRAKTLQNMALKLHVNCIINLWLIRVRSNLRLSLPTSGSMGCSLTSR